MTVPIINKSSESISLQVMIPFNSSMLDAESTSQDSINAAGL